MRKKITFTTKITIAISCLLLIANIVLGGVLYMHSKNALRTIIQERMLDVSNAAAALMDGDAMARLQAEDVDTPEYKEALRILREFQANIDLSYIYGVRKNEKGEFVFTIDPDPDDPGEFGSHIIYTEEMEEAYKGTPTVDRQPYEDRWGRSYSSYSPFFDSNGQVAGIIAVDFSAKWYEDQLKKNTYSIVIGSVVSMLVGAFIVFAITGSVRKRFQNLLEDVGELAMDLKDLTDESKMKGIREYKESQKSENPSENEESRKTASDDIDRIKDQISSMHKELVEYLSYVEKQAYVDAMTGTNNKAAYLETLHQIEKEIRQKAAEFAVVVFDINGLKKVNDNYGHEEGDRIIKAAADIIKQVFGKENVYRIGGDEFIAVIFAGNEEDMKWYYTTMERALEERNMEEPRLAIPLAIARGEAYYRPDEDTDYNSVFKRADEVMYRNKAEYYMKHGDRRRRRE